MRFKVFGFGLVTANPIVYLHYVRPNGKLKRTIRLGSAQGVCGQIKRTSRKKLFPFSAERGKWKLQFDTRKRYRKGSAGIELPLLHRRRDHQADIRLIVVAAG